MVADSSGFPVQTPGQQPAGALNLELRVRAVEPLRFRELPFLPLLMAIIDVGVAQSALVLGLMARRCVAGWLHYSITPGNEQGMVLGLFFMPFANWLLGLYPGYGFAPVERLRRRVLGVVGAFAAQLLWHNIVPSGEFSRGVELFGFGFTGFLSPLMEVFLVTTLVRCGLWGTPVLVLSSDDAGCRLANSLRSKPELGLVPVGLLKNRPEMWGKIVAGVPVLGPISLAPKLAELADTAVVAMPSFNRPRLPALFQSLPFPRVVFVPELPGLQSLWTTPLDVGGSVGIEFRRNLLLKRNYYLKRALDYVIAVPLFLASIPLIAVFALWIKRVSPGSAFYTQEREGYRGRKVGVWKLRTMYQNADQLLDSYLARNPAEREHWQRFFKLRHDPRILPGVGHLLRKTSLDELPQLWNVLKGEMSLVGPRPFPGYHLKGFPAEFRALRQSVLPGLTGYWQVSDRSDADLALQEHLDTYYIRNWSLWLDAYILALTIRTVLMPRGAY